MENHLNKENKDTIEDIKMNKRGQRAFQQQDFCKSLLCEADSLRKESVFTDVTLKCKEKKIVAHKIILASASKYFKELFTKTNVSQEIITLTMDADVMDAILTFCYTGEMIVERIQSKFFLKDVLEASETLQIPILSNYCLNLLLESPRPDELLFLWKTVTEFRSEKITKLYFEWILNNLAIIMRTDTFLKLNPTEIFSLYTQTSNIVCQNKILESIIFWVKHNEKLRVRYLTNLLKSVQWHKISEFCLAKARNERILLRNMYFQKTLETLLLLPGVPQENAENICNPKFPADHFKMLANLQAKVNCINVAEQQNGNDREMVKSVKNFKSKVSDVDNVYKLLEVSASIPRRLFINGFLGRFRKILIYNCENGKWGEVNDHPLSKKHEFAICSYKNSIYHFGGRDDFHNPAKSSYVFHTLFSKWGDCTEMSIPRWAATAVVLDNHIYILGGITNGRNGLMCLRSVERYDPNLNIWGKVADMPEVYECPPVTAVGTQLCLVSESSLIWYSPKQDKWQLDPTALPAELRDVSKRIASGNGMIFILRKINPKNVYLFNTFNCSWNQECIPVKLQDCDIIINLQNPQCLEFLIVNSDSCFIYRPPCSWKYFNPINLIVPVIAVVKGSD